MNKKILYLTCRNLQEWLDSQDHDAYGLLYNSIDKDEAIDEMVEGEKLFLVEITEVPQ